MNLWQPGMTLAQVERVVILKAFQFYERNKTKTASALGISIRALYDKLLSYGGDTNGEPGPEEEKGQGNESHGAKASSRVDVQSTAQIPKEQPVSVPVGKEVQEVLPESNGRTGARKKRSG